MSRRSNRKPEKVKVAIYGRGPSKDWKAPEDAIVIRLKRDPGACDYRSARSVIFRSTEPFWHFADIPKWLKFYKEFSSAKPSTGLCAVFMAVDNLAIDELYLPGLDSLLDGSPIHGHDMQAERKALAKLDLNVIDVRGE